MNKTRSYYHIWRKNHLIPNNINLPRAESITHLEEICYFTTSSDKILAYIDSQKNIDISTNKVYTCLSFELEKFRTDCHLSVQVCR